MTRLHVSKTGFTSGELDPELAGRVDLRAYDDGAAKLRNVIVRATGGITRRPGTKLIESLPDARRLIAFDIRDGEELVVLSPGNIEIHNGNGPVQNGIVGLWTADQLRSITWTRVGDGLLICHPDVVPQHLTRNQSGSWSVSDWQFDTATGDNGPTPAQPFSKFAGEQTIIQATNLNVATPDEAQPIPAGGDVDLRTSVPVFRNAHQGTIFRIKDREVRIQSVISDVEARGEVLQELIDGKATRFWQEQVFSDARGWPAAVTLHQDRLVISGAADAPEQVWFSKTGRYFNFDVGEGLDDEAINFRLTDSRLHRIRHLVSGRSLQILTNLGEWTVAGSPITPSNVSVTLQTNVGSPIDRQIQPIEADGATLFVGASKRDLRELLFADSEQAFQAPDIALLSRHLFRDPVDMAFDAGERLLAVVLEDGSLATATIDRNANVAAWSLQTTNGLIKAVCLFAGTLYLLIQRDGTTMLESWDKVRRLDGGLKFETQSPTNNWDGLSPLLGQTVELVADGVSRGVVEITSDSLDIGDPAMSIELGHSFLHVVEPLPLDASGRNLPLDTLFRPVRAVFRVLDTGALVVDLGRGPRPLIATNQSLQSGDIASRSLGWRRGWGRWPWRIEQKDPRSFTLLSASTEIKVNS